MDVIERLKGAKAPAWLLALAAVAGPVIGAFWADYSGFRTKQIEASVSTVNASREADQKLNDLLVKFAQLAIAEGSVSADDRAEFNRLIYEVDQKAADVSTAYPSLKGVYLKYSDSLIDLKKAADALKGPKTGKDFVRAVANYSVARDEFRNTSQEVGGSYLRTFLW